VFDDFKFADDGEAPTTSRDPFSYMSNLGPVNPAAHPDVDCDSLVAIDPTGPPLDELLETIATDRRASVLPGAMSNAMLISGDHTTTGRPIAVFGPQTGYFAPQLLVEKDVHGPRHRRARRVVCGRRPVCAARAWKELCVVGDVGRRRQRRPVRARAVRAGGGTPTTTSMGYLRNGICEPIETYQHVQIAKPSAGGIPAINENGAACDNATDDDGDGAVNDGCPPVVIPEVLLPGACDNAIDDDGDGKVNDGCLPIAGTDLVLSWRVERTAHYGPLVARGTLENGTPIAIATLRTTYNSELGSALGFYRINNPDFMTDGYNSFRQAMGEGVQYTFNWFYIDAQNIGYQHSCKCPQRAQGVDPYLPAWGNGQFDWQGFITFAEQPFDLNPAEGYMTSWNNKQAPGFLSNDRNFSYGPSTGARCSTSASKRSSRPTTPCARR
jgi:hypothetical protein